MAFYDFTDRTPMWGNVGSELQKMDPRRGTGWAPDYSSLGFWGGGQPLMSTFDKAMKDLADRRESQTKLDVANIGADTANQAQQEKRSADQALMQANQAHQLAEQAQSQAAPQLAQAKLLDAQISAFAPIYEQQQNDYAQAQCAANAASAAWQEKQLTFLFPL